MNTITITDTGCLGSEAITSITVLSAIANWFYKSVRSRDPVNVPEILSALAYITSNFFFFFVDTASKQNLGSQFTFSIR